MSARFGSVLRSFLVNARMCCPINSFIAASTTCTKVRVWSFGSLSIAAMSRVIVRRSAAGIRVSTPRKGIRVFETNSAHSADDTPGGKGTSPLDAGLVPSEYSVLVDNAP